MGEITKVLLLSVPLEKDYAHTLYFESVNAQYNYFYGKKKKEYTNFSFQRHDNTIRIPEHIDDLLAAGCNYVMYKNPSYDNKWFYAFITNMEYKNEGCTVVSIRTDCIQTWMDEVTVKPSFVEREHASSDEIGEHTIEEGLETGSYTINSRFEFNYGDGYAVVVGVTKSPDGLIGAGGQVHGIYSGAMYYALENTTNGNPVNEFVKGYDEGAADAITCMFLAPKALVASTDGTVTFGEHVPNRGTPHKTMINKPISAWTGYDAEVVHEFTTGDVNGYTPRNKKLMCYPFRYLLASNNAGAAAVYHLEKFAMYNEEGKRTQLEPTFTVFGCLTPGCSVRMVPHYYNGAIDNHEEGLNMGKFPILNWSSDVYTNWLTQNGTNIAIDLLAGTAQIAAGVGIAMGTGGLGAGIGGGTVLGGAAQIASTIGQVHQQSFTPPQARGNLNSGDVVTACYDNSFHFYTMSVKAEMARVIDDYFDMYGYKCHRVKYPEKNHRAEYWYTKTIDANITGAIPQEDLQTIKDCYNRGITFWKHPQNFRNYKVLNPIVVSG
jgi:hypothetical protein